MTDDTAAPRFTEADMLNEANMYALWAKGSDSITERDCYQKTANLLRQAADDLASAPTREELAQIISGLSFDTWSIGSERHANCLREGQVGYSFFAEIYKTVDKLIAAGVKVRHE